VTRLGFHGSGAGATGHVRRAHRHRPGVRADAVPPEVVASADMILVAAGTGVDPQSLAAALHIDGEVAARAVCLTGTDVLAVPRGSLIALRVRP
jgi:hypothetical protein